MSNDAIIRFQSQGEVLAAYVAARDPIDIIQGPIAGRKTTETCFKLFQIICQQKPDGEKIRRSRWAVLRPTYPELTSITIRDWRRIVPAGCGRMTMGTPPEHKLDFDLPDGTRVMAEVLFVAMDKPDQVEKLRGSQLTGAWMNEVKLFAEGVLHMLVQRIDRYPGQGQSTYAGIIGDTNAWDQDHWLEKMAEAERQGERTDVRFFVQPGAVIKDPVTKRWKVNPARENRKFVGDEYYERQLAALPEDRIKVELGNQIGLSIDGKPVQPSFSDAAHTATTLILPTAGTIYVGLDFGLTPGALFWQRQIFDLQKGWARWIALNELALFDMGAPKFAGELKTMMAQLRNECVDKARAPLIQFEIFGDPSGGQRDASERTYFKILAANGVIARSCATNEPSVRREALDRVLTRMVGGQPGALINARCKMFRKGLAGAWHYRRVQGVTGRFADEPVKNEYSHVCEAGEYGLLGAGENASVSASGQSGPPPVPTGVVKMKQNWSPFD